MAFDQNSAEDRFVGWFRISIRHVGHNVIEDISTGIGTTVLTARTPGNNREERFRNVPGACRGASWEEEQTQLKLSGPRNVPNSNFSCCISDGIFNVIS